MHKLPKRVRRLFNEFIDRSLNNETEMEIQAFNNIPVLKYRWYIDDLIYILKIFSDHSFLMKIIHKNKLIYKKKMKRFYKSNKLYKRYVTILKYIIKQNSNFNAEQKEYIVKTINVYKTKPRKLSEFLNTFFNSGTNIN